MMQYYEIYHDNHVKIKYRFTSPTFTLLSFVFKHSFCHSTIFFLIYIYDARVYIMNIFFDLKENNKEYYASQCYL